ncbi:GGDEF domain-containing protein [Kineococcus sp. SYSU DK005]|uniref:GGDEF domain-containing protein n=1 Tax=Kineococcus sp. SYSU DK005 TaxID=3383126 RepID=UPI003D7D3DC1
MSAGALEEGSADPTSFSSIGALVCTAAGVVLQVNDTAVELLGHSRAALLGRDLYWLIAPEHLPAATAACAAITSGAVDAVVHQTRLRCAGGRTSEVRLTTSRLQGASGSEPRLVVHLQDVSAHEHRNRQLLHAAMHDPLTGLANRAKFLRDVHVALSRARRHERRVALLYLDLEHFKVVNDTHGHAAGDAVLRAFAAHLRAVLRPGDTPARLGGDEFAVVCEDTGLEQAQHIAARLASFQVRWPPQDPPPRTATAEVCITVRATIGIATTPDASGQHLQGEELLRAADSAMYRAKKRG